ncbi:16S rRNA (guanine(966)-N(2))-methyltransferase RsmD [Zavarzinia sp. CC-PAN008]|uniref:16S rRNA (guanine(966)-N(2))-methyltransferase RsmD n=1 Tax=Zavarzinia sp. CC-PAN008 TaxID=3243332 RepID=UPI003F748910
MRIVAGRHRGRTLASPPDDSIRPTADRLRQALFDILTTHPAVDLDGARVLDVFAGTGALGLEALSRGAAHATFLDDNAGAIRLILQNVRTLKEEGRTRVLQRDARKPGPAPHGPAADLALLDAPYNKELSAPALSALAAQGWLAPGCLCVVELARDEAFAPPPGFAQEDERAYGHSRFVFLERTDP